MAVSQPPTKTEIVAIRTTSGRELDVALIVERRVVEKLSKGENLGVKSILVIPGIKGFIFIETAKPSVVPSLVYGVKYVKSSRYSKIPLSEVSELIKPKVAEEVSAGEEVEVVKGPFRGMKAVVVSVDKSKGTVTLNILEAAFSIPITVPISYIKKKGV
jgi:transcriptional antiterminator NusG